MKKFLFLPLLALISLPLFAMPAAGDQLIQSLVSKNQEFKKMVEQQTSDGFFSNYDRLSIELINASEEIKERCNEWSRSGSFLKVEFKTIQGIVKTEYFSTPESAKQLKKCRN